ncbi:MAG TPA: SDR family oxidoreductase [Bdellovibrionota bacterium]|jgi:NAD(P)-dependent dehydrogenase (short-subunit alcohol dehydrogenase family)|nr:SDR family oxidoreductase [Bdellovibrionota bacterium]
MTTQQKVAFITGANRGIGLETALQLGKQGVRVIAGSRDRASGEAMLKSLATHGVEADLLNFDVNRREDHLSAFDYIQKNYGRLDILVNNAGILRDADNGTASTTPQNVLRETFDANFFNLVALTQTLLPLIRLSNAGRIVNLSSSLGSLAQHSDPTSPIYGSWRFAYNSSKTALNAFTVHLAQELKDTPIKVNSAHPGWVKTDMGGEGAMLDVEDGARTSVQLALLPESGPTGGYFHLDKALPW